MTIVVNLLTWLHLVALAVGMGAGLGMSQVGPRLVAAAPDQRPTWWPLANVFSRAAAVALALLLVTGPLLVWLKYGGGLDGWFTVKLALVAVAALLIGLSHWGLARLRRGDEGGGRLMGLTGPLTMPTVLALVLAAVFAFN